MAGTNSPGLNTVIWDMTIRLRERTEEEKKAAEQQRRRFADMGFGMMGAQDPNFIVSPAGTGLYKVVLTVGALKMSQTVSILEDDWFDK